MRVCREFLHRVGSGGTPLQFIVVGFVPSDWEGDGHHSPLGDTAVDVVDNTSEQISDVEIPSPGAVNGGGKPTEDRKLCHPSQNKCPVTYCNKANYGPMSSGV